MMLNESEWCEVMIGSDSKKTFKEYVFECYQNGDSVKEIAEVINKSTSTVYRYIQTIQDKVRYPILKTEIKIALVRGNFKSFIANLSYTDICLIRREFYLSGYNKETKIQAILNFFKDFITLGLYPWEFDKNDIKIAFRKRAKETHPDLNKKVGKFGEEFQEVHRVYTKFVKIYS